MSGGKLVALRKDSGDARSILADAGVSVENGEVENIAVVTVGPEGIVTVVHDGMTMGAIGLTAAIFQSCITQALIDARSITVPISSVTE